ncbi:hypothetical protein ACJMK2_010031 [Sinanodonta woodiana]|uniref:Importin N-terminal domain-containing protein n=1 Tax=Sinanodonta woodiana TaxID=1069815 RepID=A0ABD3VH53_SINWO
MATTIEEILSRLLVPDNSTIQQATQEIKAAFKDASIVPALCQTLGSSQNPLVRQYAAILLRRKILKGKQWRQVSGDLAQSIRENVLHLILQESQKNTQNAIAQLVATIAKHDLPNSQWPQLFQFIQMHAGSENAAHKEVGMFVLYSVSSVAAEQLKPHLHAIIQLCIQILPDQQASLAPYYAIKTLTEMIFFVGDEELASVQQLVPQVLQVVKQLITQDEEKASDAFELFHEMLECEVGIMIPHVKSTVEFCLEQILKHKLVDRLLSVLFPVMCSGSDEEEEEEEEVEEAESQKPAQYAAQVIDTMAMYLPPEKFIPNLMRLVEPALTSERPGPRRAAHIAMAVVVEGCADYVTAKYFEPMLDCVCKGLNDPDSTVRNGALFALGQFSEHLQPKISKYASQVLPLLFQYLGRASQEADKNPRGLTRSYYALETFCQNLEKDILPYLPSLMEHIMTVLKTATNLNLKELVISAIGATASAAEEHMQPYFPEIIEQFRVYLGAGDNEEMIKLQVQAIDTLGVLARTVGAQTFQPLAKECIQFGLNLLNMANDPDQRRCIYGLFAAISGLLKSDMSEYLSTIMHYMMLSLRTSEGVKAHLKEDKDQVTIFDDEDFEDEEELDGEEDEDDEQHIEGISVENAYIDEKEDTSVALGEIAVNVGASFMPFLEESYEEVLKLVDYPADRVKKGATMAIGQLCCCVHNTFEATQSQEAQTALMNMLKTVIPKFLTVIKEDVDRVVVMTTVDVIHDILEKIGEMVLQVTGASEQILFCMKEIFTHQVACQDKEEEEEDGQDAEYDGMLIESAGDVIPIMAKLMGGPSFTPFFSSFLTDLLKRLRQTSSVAEKSFAVGTLAETIQACGPTMAAYVDILYPLFMKMIHEEDDEVRSNTVFALGVLVVNGGEKLYPQYPEILKALFDVLSKETNGRVQDNICAATCRLVWSHQSAVPLEHVIPVVVKLLPLKEDFEENPTVFKCLFQLFEAGSLEIAKQLPTLLTVCCKVLGTKEIKTDTESMIIQFVRSVHHKFPQDFDNLKSTLPPAQAAKLDTCLVVVNGLGC